MPDIFINTQRPIDRSIVAGINQPQREAPIGAYVAGSTYDTNLYFVLNDGTYDAASGAAGQDVQVAISTIATPESGTFTLSDGTDTTAAITYGASAQTVEDALNALNTDTGPNGSLVDVVKQSNTQYTVTFRTLGAQTAISGSTVSLYPESTPTGSIAVTGDASTYAQQVIELTRQPAIYQQTWSTITNGFNGTLALNTTRLLQSLVLEEGQPFYIEIKLNGETVAREVVGMELSTMPASAFSGTAVASLLDAFATDPTVNASFDPVAWANALSATLGAVTSVNGEVGAVVLDMDDIAETATNKILTTAERASIASASQPGHTHVISDITNNTAASTGLLTGGVLSNGAGATEYSITDGTGLVVTAAGAITNVSWTGKSNITPTNIASALLTWVSIDSAGNVVERTDPISASQARSEIFLGVVVHTDLATVQNVNVEAVVSYQTGNTVHDLADAIGFVNINGNVFTANGTNLSIDKSAGVIFKLGGNYDQDTTNPHNRTIAANTLAQFQYRFNDGTSGPLTDTLIDPDNLDDGAGGLTAVTNNRWSVQRIYIFLSGNIKIQRGVEDFPTKATAIEGIASEAYVVEDSIAQNGLLRGWLVVKKQATDLSDDSVAQFISAPKFGEGSVGGTSTPPGDASAILLPALKASAGTINVGEVVRSTGYSGGQILVELADADAAGEMPAMGVARSSFTEASAGTVIFSGVLAGLNTSSFAVNDSLYVSTTPGVLTNTRPTGAATGVQAIARVLSQDASAGVIQVISAGRTNDLPNLTADTLWYGNGSAVPTEATITTYARTLLDDADAATARATLGADVTELGIAVSDETTALTTGVAKGTFRMPYAMTVTDVRATVTTAPTGANIIVDINDGGTSIMTTNLLSIDATEKTSTTAATAPNITDTALADDAEITIDIDQIGSTIAGAGLKIWIIGTRA